jgi:hypothetical protein
VELFDFDGHLVRAQRCDHALKVTELAQHEARVALLELGRDALA